MVHRYILQPAQMPLMPLSLASPHSPFGVGNCAAHGQYVQMHECADKQKLVEIFLIWIPSILPGIYIFSYHLSASAVFAGPNLAVLCHFLALPAPKMHSSRFSLRVSQAMQSVPCRQGWHVGQLQRRTTWGDGKNKEGLSLASHWGHLVCPLCKHQYLARTFASPSRSRSWGPMALHKQMPTALHTSFCSCRGAFAEVECILPWCCFVLFRNSV